ncbi:hypothetical protein JIN85_09065 [Luteolibacter pohnpeiensis]|uniref:Uncharacterized protein n=1 Tax=Luteolibacter pohnpeiensis TaxID=454153 RepID=A0A934S3M6_9BACT|nr:hypothetical protein [Luteolibacter pohnpeiensis]MBK1882565.1 hypothetical protein [Luteolibacter pohnpeiensis]
MSQGKVSWPVVCLGLARMILQDRTERRKILFWMLLAVMAGMAIGLWGINAWLMESALRFLLWWGGCILLTILVILFALYDALAVIREEREKLFRDD